MRLAIPGSLLALTLAACASDPCGDYTAYMCDCHATDTATTSCDELETIYSDASPDLQEECTVALQDQEDKDAEDSYTCESSDTGA